VGLRGVEPVVAVVSLGGAIGSLGRWALAGAHCPPAGYRPLYTTTNSTFGYETLRLVGEGAYGYAALNAGAGILAGLGAAFGGGAVAQAVRQ
jgi:fluoride ion exporter CrcB/FEX